LSQESPAGQGAGVVKPGVVKPLAYAEEWAHSYFSAQGLIIPRAFHLWRKTTVLRFNNSLPMDIRGVRLILELALSRATTVLRKEVNHAKPRSNDDA
jgi:hypothetical protein